jgi:hypothetical protein
MLEDYIDIDAHKVTSEKISENVSVIVTPLIHFELILLSTN